MELDLNAVEQIDKEKRIGEKSEGPRKAQFNHIHQILA